MSKATAIKDAIKKWEDKNQKNAADATDIGLQFQWPPIEKMDSTLAVLQNCTKISLSTNMIEKIAGIGTLKNLRVLSVSRNHIKSLAGIEALGETLEELWASYNFIDKTKPLEGMKALKVFYVSYNLIKDWGEFNRFNMLPGLEEVSFAGNPLVENLEENVYKAEAVRRLTYVKKFDGEPVIRGI